MPIPHWDENPREKRISSENNRKSWWNQTRFGKTIGGFEIEEEAKLYQIKEYQDKGEKMDEEECLMKEAFDNLQVKQMKI